MKAISNRQPLVNQEDACLPRSVGKASLSLFLELGKMRLSILVVTTTLTGYILACRVSIDGWRLFWTLAGTACAALGANSFNQWWEVRRDARMERTRNRPLPTGRLTPSQALIWSTSISFTGVLLLASQVNEITALLALANILLYVLVYTPLKPISSINTLAGAICGAIPPMMGWTAVTGQLGYGAWLLGATLFIWQIPHFLSLAWLHRDDYARGGFRMLPHFDPNGQITCQIIALYSLSLLPLGLAYYLGGLTGFPFLFGSLLLGGAFFKKCYQLYFERNEIQARQVFLASLIYLPLLMTLLIADWSVSSFRFNAYPASRPVPIHPYSSNPQWPVLNVNLPEGPNRG